jgi:lipopolysaccharide biosynthesis protein
MIGRWKRRVKKKITQWKEKASARRILVPAIEIPFHSSLPSVLEAEPPPRIFVFIHIYYVDLAESLLGYLPNLPFPFDLYISTDQPEKAAVIQKTLERLGQTCQEIRLCPNRGRDVAPKILRFADLYSRYDYFLHLHSKKSLHDPVMGAAWRKYLCQSLVGSPEIVRSIFQIFSQPHIGVVFPRYMAYYDPQFRWGQNLLQTTLLLKKMGITITEEERLDFPAGSMFWGRSAILKPLLDLQLQMEDFEEEAGQLDGTLGHAIERSITFLAKKAGYDSQQVVPSEHRIEGLKFVRVRFWRRLAQALRLCRQLETARPLP